MKLPALCDRLDRSFYERPTELVARELLGKALLRRLGGQWVGGWVVETEAYLPEGDLASHSTRGKTPSNAAMFGPPGLLYVYPIHAKYCMNTVTEAEGKGCAVLIRAIEPVWGIDRMRMHRGTDELRRLSRGPAMLCQALKVDRTLDSIDLVTSKQIMIADCGNSNSTHVTVTQRIGISKSKDSMLRYFVDGNWYVSGRASDHQSPPSKELHASREQVESDCQTRPMS